MGEDDALDHMKKALAESHPDISLDDILSKYKALADAEDAALQAELGLDEAKKESEKLEEDANEAEVS